MNVNQSNQHPDEIDFHTLIYSYFWYMIYKVLHFFSLLYNLLLISCYRKVNSLTAGNSLSKLASLRGGYIKMKW